MQDANQDDDRWSWQHVNLLARQLTVALKSAGNGFDFSTKES